MEPETWGGPCNEPEGLNNAGKPCQVTTCQATFHVYSLEWDRTGPADELRWYIDGTLTHKVVQGAVPAATGPPCPSTPAISSS